MDMIFNDGVITLKNQESFEPKHVFECGQCFRWKALDDGSYTGVVDKYILNVFKVDNDIHIKGLDERTFSDFFVNYFDLKTNYDKIKKELIIDDIMKTCVEFGNGIRILKQDKFETLISFIISANNRIPMIARSIKELSKNFGQRITDDYYMFPKVIDLAKASISEIEACGVGFRAKYIQAACQKIINEGYDLDYIASLETHKCREELIEFAGVGPKVSDCVMLFSMNKYDLFPTDVWVKRICESLYFKGETNINSIHDFAKEKYGNLGGYAQQYLFYYARENKI